MNNGENHSPQDAMGELDALLADFEAQADPQSRERLTRIVQTLLDFHAAGLRKMLELIFESSEHGQALIDALARDAAVSSLLVLHDLHPDDVNTRVEQALDSVRPYLASHHGRVELLGVSDEGVVHLRLEGNCHGCPSSRLTLQNSIEQAIYAAAPEIAGIQVDGIVNEPEQPTTEFVPLHTNIAPGREAAQLAAACPR